MVIMTSKDCEKTNEPPALPNRALQLMESYGSLRTCLSPSVHNLLCDIGISNAVDDVLTPDFILDWSKLDQKLELIGKSDDITEYYCDAVKNMAAYIESVRTTYQPLSPQKFAASLGPFLLWTRNDKVCLQVFELLQENSSPSTPVLAGLLLTACIEKALGDSYLSKGHTVPYLVKDIIASPEIEQIFGKQTVKVLQILMGPPQSLNLRNILWHGFISPSELDARYGFFLLAVVIGMGVKLSERNINWENLKFRHFVGFNTSQIPCTVFPDIGNQEVLELQEVFKSSLLVLPLMKEHWQYCLKKYLECRFGECITLLIPQFEHLLRVLFSSVNNCPERVLTAEATCHFTNLSIILSEFLDDGKKNCIRACLGDNIMELLLDLFMLPEGPRIRDRISHGEADFFRIPKFLVIHLLSIAAVICLKVGRKSNKSSYLMELSQMGNTYQTVFHPFSILKRKIFELAENLGTWKSCPVVEPEHLNCDTVLDASFLDCETVHTCVSLVGETFGIHHLVFRFNSYSEGLDHLLASLQKFRISSVYRPKVELQLSSRLRNIVHHSLKSSQNICQALNDFYNVWTCQTLRSRRKLTYVRLLKSLFTLYSGLYIVLLIVVGHVLVINKSSQWSEKELLLSQKLLKKILTYTENLGIQTDSNKNMWVESSHKTKEFLNMVNGHCESLKKH